MKQSAARTIPLETFSRAVMLNAASIVHLLEEEGLNVESDGDHHIVAQWPIRVARVGLEPRCSVVFTRNTEGVWRGAYLESEGPNAWGLKDAKPHFRDLLHVGIWLRGHAPKTAAPVSPARLV